MCYRDTHLSFVMHVLHDLSRGFQSISCVHRSVFVHRGVPCVSTEVCLVTSKTCLIEFHFLCAACVGERETADLTI